MRTFDRYKENLSIVHYDGADYIQSYTTKVAKIDYNERTAIILGRWSMTTSKHINYACKKLGLEPIKQDENENSSNI